MKIRNNYKRSKQNSQKMAGLTEDVACDVEADAAVADCGEWGDAVAPDADGCKRPAVAAMDPLLWSPGLVTDSIHLTQCTQPSAERCNVSKHHWQTKNSSENNSNDNHKINNHNNNDNHGINSMISDIFLSKLLHSRLGYTHARMVQCENHAQHNLATCCKRTAQLSTLKELKSH